MPNTFHASATASSAVAAVASTMARREPSASGVVTITALPCTSVAQPSGSRKVARPSGVVSGASAPASLAAAACGASAHAGAAKNGRDSAAASAVRIRMRCMGIPRMRRGRTPPSPQGTGLAVDAGHRRSGRNRTGWNPRRRLLLPEPLPQPPLALGDFRRHRLAEILQLVERTDLQLARPGHRIGAALGPLDRLVHVPDLPDPIARDQFARLGEGAID